MAEKIYTLEQAAAKLGKSPEEFKALAKNNKISELRKGSDILYNAKDVDALAASGSDDTVLSIEDSVIGLSDESSLLGLASLDQSDEKADEFEIDADMSSMVELTEADTRAGIDAVKGKGVEDSVLSLADSVSEEPEAKINADADIAAGAAADGSGSGLLDLSLQADDSQFGAVLDDILPGGDKDGGGGFDDFSDSVPSSGDAMSKSDAVDASDEAQDEPESIYASEPSQAVSAPGSAAPAAAMVYQQIESDDPASGTFGVMMLLPLLTIIFAAIVITAGFKSVTPSMLLSVEDYMMYIFAGLAAVALIIGIVGCVAGSGSGEKAAKPVKQAAPAKEKPAPKPKKKK